MEYTQLIGVDDLLNQVTGCILPYNQNDGSDQTGNEQHELNDVRPNDGLHTTHQGVDGRNYGGGNDAGYRFKTSECFHGDRDGGHDCRHPSETCRDKDATGQEARRIIESPFQILIDRDDLQPIKKIQEKVDHDGHGHESTNIVQH